jgi:hypothetical protein
MNAETLRNAIANTAAARATHAADAQALTLGRARLADARGEVERLATADAEATARHASKLAEQARSGNTGLVPWLVPSAEDVTAFMMAERTVRAADQSVASLEFSERASQIALIEATEHERHTRTALKRAESDAIAARVLALRDEEYQLCARLAVTDLGSASTVLTPKALDVLANPRARPRAEMFFGQGIASDIHASRAGDLQAVAAANSFWDTWETNLLATPATTSIESAA